MPHPRFHSALLFLVFIGPAISLHVPLAGTVRNIVNVSLYELAMLPVALVVLTALPRLRISHLRLAICLVPVCLIVAHSLYAALALPDLSLGDLLKDTVKYAGFFLFTLSLSIYLSLYVKRPAFQQILIVALLFVLVLMVIEWVRFAGAGHGVPGGSITPHAAVVLLFLFTTSQDRSQRASLETCAMAIGTVFAIALWGTKLFMGFALGVAVWALLGDRFTALRARWRIGPLLLAAAALLLAVGVLIWWELAAPYGRSLTRSLTERLDLWRLAWELFESNRPWGIGLGQYAATAVKTPDVIDYYPHNTALTALTELGFLGFVFMAFLLALVFLSIGVSPQTHVWIALAIALGPMLLHDVMSYRSLQILLAAGLAGLLEHDNAFADRVRGR